MELAVLEHVSAFIIQNSALEPMKHNTCLFPTHSNPLLNKNNCSVITHLNMVFPYSDT